MPKVQVQLRSGPFPNAASKDEASAPVYFLHIPKTAGSTMTAHLESLFLPSQFWNADGGTGWTELLQKPRDKLQSAAIFNWHLGGYLFTWFPQPLRYFTFLRDPLARALSHHAHVMRDENHYLHQIAIELGSFGAYLRDPRTQPTIANFQLRNIGATFDPQPLFQALTPAQVAAHELEHLLDTLPPPQSAADQLMVAKARLEQMCFVGITERFDQSLSLLCEIFNWPQPVNLRPVNIGQNRKPVRDLGSTDRKLLEKLNGEDIELYEAAKARFEQDWKRSYFVYPKLHAFVSYAQNAEDVLLHRVLREVDHGTYVDVGANEPDGDSVTKAFYDRGWRGVNIEPVRTHFESLQRSRPEDVNVHAAAGAQDARLTLYEIPGTGLSTLDSAIADKHRQQGFRVKETEIAVVPLQKILEDARVLEPHFLKIDVEGWEREVLLGLDLSSIRPWVILIEATEPNSEVPSYDAWEQIVLGRGYTFEFFDGLNRYYLAQEKQSLREGFSRPVNSADRYVRAADAVAANELRRTTWALRKTDLLLGSLETRVAEATAAQAAAFDREREATRHQITELGLWANSADTYGKSLLLERDTLREALIAAQKSIEDVQAASASQIEALSTWAKSADESGKALLAQSDQLKALLAAEQAEREKDRTAAQDQIHAVSGRAASAETKAETLTAMLDAQRAQHEADAESARKQIEALSEWARSAEAHGLSLKENRESLLAIIDADRLAREAEQSHARAQIDSLSAWAKSAEAHAKSLAEDGENLLRTLDDEREARNVERRHALAQVEALTAWAKSADAYGKSQAEDRTNLLRALEGERAGREADREQIRSLGAWAQSADEHGRSLLHQRDELAKVMAAAEHAHQAEMLLAQGRIDDLAGRAIEADARVLLAQGRIDELTGRAMDADARVLLAQGRIDELTGRAMDAEARAQALLAMNQKLGEDLDEALRISHATVSGLQDDLGAIRLERSAAAQAWLVERENQDHLIGDLQEQVRQGTADRGMLARQQHAMQEQQLLAAADWRTERKALEQKLSALQERFDKLTDHWAVRALVNKRYIKMQPRPEAMNKRKIGVFTIASKNYLSYVRVLLKSIEKVHPEYARYLCLVDTVDGAFDASKEHFKVVQSDEIGIPKFLDMSIRYDIMEFNTAVKPFMFQWLLDNTDLDSILYIDPDIRAYARFDRLEAILRAQDTSVVLTPHITRPLEDGKIPNDYHMLQSGVFNLGFCGINRCSEARSFVDWWGRRLETQGEADFSRNLFTDQRWCDLAPCFLDGLKVLKSPGYNVAYWNLAERTITRSDGIWYANGEPLAFFHFSGVNAGKENVVSKHQNRFEFADVPVCKALFDDYRQALIDEGWESTKTFGYAYGATSSGMHIPGVFRQLYRETFPQTQTLVHEDLEGTLLRLSTAKTGTLNQDDEHAITRVMDIIYRQRPDLRAVFDLGTPKGREAFHAWFADSAAREYHVPDSAIPVHSPTHAETSKADVSTSAGSCAGAAIMDSDETRNGIPLLADLWANMPRALQRVLAPAFERILSKQTPGAPVINVEAKATDAVVLSIGSATPGRYGKLHLPADIPQLIPDSPVSLLMYLIWSSRPDLQTAFDLATAEGQSHFVGWYKASAEREYGLSSEVRTVTSENSGNEGSQNSETTPKHGANLIGYAHAELGMGEHVRMSAAALDLTGVPFSVVNFNVGVASRQHAQLEHGDLTHENPFPVNLFHINADQMLLAYCKLGNDFFDQKYNVGYWAWELSKCPDEWVPLLSMIDEVWAPSRFIQDAFAERATVPVEYMPLCVTLPEFKALGRAFFDLPQRAFVFLYTFDFFSFLDRKNPFAAIEAFKLAFPSRKTDVCLVLKIMNGDAQTPKWQTMMKLIDNDPRIVIMNRTMGRHEVLALFETSNCFVSLHRSEGFGRGPAEAMYLGKPVIVTNYSGNTDYTLPDNSCVVNYTLIDVKEGQYPFSDGQVWADPDVSHAAWYMKRLQEDAAYGRNLGARGKAFIHDNFNQRTIGALYEARLKQLGFA